MPSIRHIAVLALLAGTAACAPQMETLPASTAPMQVVDPQAPEAVMVPVAAHIRQLAEMGAGPVGLDSVAISGEALTGPELQTLQQLLPGVATGGVMQFQTNCRPRGGCELTVRRWFKVESPVAQGDGTVTVRVTHSFRTPSMRMPTATFVADLVLSRSAEGWSLVRVRPVMAD